MCIKGRLINNLGLIDARFKLVTLVFLGFGLIDSPFKPIRSCRKGDY